MTDNVYIACGIIVLKGLGCAVGSAGGTVDRLQIRIGSQQLLGDGISLIGGIVGLLKSYANVALVLQIINAGIPLGFNVGHGKQAGNNGKFCPLLSA